METTTERLWTIQDVSDYLGIPVKTLYDWRHRLYGPKAKRVGKHVRYRPEDVIRWFEEL
jgi:predicted DNA-binding transcriptional regulator AlpA